VQTWLRLIRFVAVEDGLEWLGEPVDQEIDVGLAHAAGDKIEAYALDAQMPWDPQATRTGEIRTVMKVIRH
jgi:hypothetical protein